MYYQTIRSATEQLNYAIDIMANSTLTSSDDAAAMDHRNLELLLMVVMMKFLLVALILWNETSIVELNL